MATRTLSAFERSLLNRIQEGLPVAPRPFLAIARELGATEERVLAGIALLKRKGIVRRIGGVFSSREMGFVTTLVAAKVAARRLTGVVRLVNAFREVTHNYLRNNDLNLWFTLTAKSRRRIREIVSAVGRAPGVERIVELPALKHYKVEVKFTV